MASTEISREEAALITAAIAAYLAKPPPQPERRAEPAPLLLEEIEKRMTQMESEYKAYVQALLDEMFSRLEKRFESMERVLLALKARVERFESQEGGGLETPTQTRGGRGEVARWRDTVKIASTTSSLWSLLGRYSMGRKPERRRRG